MPSRTISSNWILLSLAISAFAIGSTEFISVGLLPLLTRSFGISLSQGGMTVSLYAAGITVGAPVLALLTNRWNRKHLLLAIMVTFLIGNLLAATAPTFGILLAGRIIAALAHGIFMAIASLIAADVVAPQKRASAIAVMFTGLTLATVTGVPLGTFIGEHLGWRASFLFLILLGLVGLITNALLVPRDLPLPRPTSVKGIWRILKQPQLLLILIITALGYGATFPVYTYLTPILNQQMGWSTSAIVVMGLFAFMNVPGLQLYIVQLAETYTPNEVSLASALNISAFNVGIMLGSGLGGQAVAQDQLTNTPWLGIGMLVFGIGVAAGLQRLENRQPQRDIVKEHH